MMQERAIARQGYTLPEITNVLQEISGNSDLATLFWIGSAVEFAFGSLEQQQRTAGQIRRFHTPLEHKRGYDIPPESYRDVLMMIIEMGERAYEQIHGPMSYAQRLEYFEECQKMGHWMEIPDLPQNYDEYLQVREESLHHNYHPSEYAKKLFQSYRSHFGPVRYYLIKQIMALLSPPLLKPFHRFRCGWFFSLALKLYRHVRSKYTITLLEVLLIPKRYRRQAHAINVWASRPRGTQAVGISSPRETSG